MSPPPEITWPRFSIHSSSHEPIIWWSLVALAIASPDVCLVSSYLIMEAVSDSDVKASQVVDGLHDELELSSMSILATGLGMVNEQIGMDHLVQQSLLDFACRAILQ